MMFCGVTRYTLLLGARAAVLMLTNGKDIETSWVLPYCHEDFSETLSNALKRHPFYPLKIVVDSPFMDVKQEALPPVSPWTRRQIVDRQRRHFFPKAQLETSLSFKAENGIWQALHTAILDSTAFVPVFELLRKITNPIEPLSLFATEWFVMASRVAVLPKKGWYFANILGESFGLRQLLIKDGKVVFTRSHQDCVPSMPQHELAERIAHHIRSTLDYAPRIDAALASIKPHIYVADSLKEVAHTAHLAPYDVIVVPNALPPTVQDEWRGDMAWLHIAATQKSPFMPVDTVWLKEMRQGIMKKQIALWVLIAFGSAGIYSGMSILTGVDKAQFAQQPAAVPSLAMEPVKPTTMVEPPLPTPPDLKLNAVIYNNPQDWVVWINGEKHIPGELKNHLTLLDVSPQSVQVRWEDGKAHQQMTLNVLPTSGSVQ